MLNLSVIVPVYNVEKYILPCLESIFRQGLDEECFEVIIVNDGSNDRSMDIIQDLIIHHPNITVVTQENQGLSMARNNGMEVAKGEYVLFVDGDDLLIDDSLSYLINKAISSKADLVVADYIKMNEDQIVQFSDKTFKQGDRRIQVKKGEELFVQDLKPNCCYVWRTIYNRDFLNRNHLRFIPNICFEDIPFTHECYVRAGLCIKINWFLIIYRQGHKTITSTFDKKKGLDYSMAIAKTWNIQHHIQMNTKALHKLQQDVYKSFSFMMCSASHTIKPCDMRELVNLLLQEAPDLQFTNGLKQRVTSFLFRQMPNVYVRSRHLYGKYAENVIIPFYNHKLKRFFISKTI